MVEQRAVNSPVAGSSPASAAHPIPTAPAYAVTQEGVVTRGSKRLKGCQNKLGYWNVTLRAGLLKRRQVGIHVLVLETFVGPCPPGQEARHLDGNPANNRLSNLCWGTPLENANDKRRHGTVLRGERHPHARLTEHVVLAARQRAQNGELVCAMAIEYGVTPAVLRSAVNGRKWKHLPGAIKRKPGPRRQPSSARRANRRDRCQAGIRRSAIAAATAASASDATT